MIERGSRLFDRLIVSVLHNEAKAPLFSVQERMEMLTRGGRPFPNVEVDCFQGLLADYALTRKASVILRGIRAISDYENELQMALMNRRLQPGLETVFLLAGRGILLHQFAAGEGGDRARRQYRADWCRRWWNSGCATGCASRWHYRKLNKTHTT